MIKRIIGKFKLYVSKPWELFTSLSLKLKLSIAMMMITLLMVGLLSYIHYENENVLINDFKEDTLSLSTAIQIGIQQMTMVTGKTDEARLRSYIKDLNKKGVKEISIINNQNEVIASSNPKHKGQILRIIHPKKEFMITTSLGEENPSKPQKSYNIIVPIIVGNVQLGYAHIVMHLDDIQSILEKTFYERILVAIIILSFGISAIIYLSNRYTKPLYNVIDAAKNISDGNLKTRLAEDRNDEIGVLNKSFNNMIKSLSEKKELENRLRKSEELSKLGQLSAGLAHEIKNPLNFINLSIDHLKTKAMGLNGKMQEEFVSTVDAIKAELYRLNRLTEQFLNHGRTILINKQPINLNLLLAQIIELIRSKIESQNITLDLSMPDSIVYADGEVEHLRTAILNIVINAIEAMPDGGKLTVRLSMDSTQCYMGFKDTGSGITEDDLDKVFEPFFTTKETGIGFGLAICKDIITQHNGSISVKSMKDHETEFTVSLPLSKVQFSNAV